MYEVQDKVVLVTGGAAGIGAGLVHAFLEQGAKHIAALDVDVTNGETLQSDLSSKYGSGKVKFYKCDVTSNDLEAAYESVLKEHGYIDVVVNCAGIMNDDPKVYLKEIAVNVTALITSSLKAYEIMRKDHSGKGGTIINISSILALYRASLLPIYAATKSAVLQFSNCLGCFSGYFKLNSGKAETYGSRIAKEYALKIKKTEVVFSGFFKQWKSGDIWIAYCKGICTKNKEETVVGWGTGVLLIQAYGNASVFCLTAKYTLFDIYEKPHYLKIRDALQEFCQGYQTEPHYPASGVRVLTVCFGATDTTLISKQKMCAFDEEIDKMLLVGLKRLPCQSPESAVNGLIHAYKVGTGGSTWLVTSDKPAEDITENITKGYEFMSKGVKD